MKGLIAWIVGVALTASLAVAPTVIANENGEVHYYSTETSMNGEPMFEPAATVVPVAGPGIVMAAGTRIYLVNDDPAYDLSGAGDHWFLVGDGTAFQDNHWKNTAAFAAATGPDRPEVVPIFAEYRQDWLAVAAGDRPVRTFTAPPSVMETAPAVAPAMVYTNPETMDHYTYSSTQYTETPKKKAVHRRTHTARYSKARVHHRHRATLASATKRHHRVASATVKRHRRTTTVTTTNRPAYTYAEAGPVVATAVTEVRTDQAGHQLFQMHSSWYMKNNGDWFRGASWRGPFVKVSKGLVPREVKMSEKHPSRIDMD